MTQLHLPTVPPARDFIRATLTAPSSSCQVDLHGIGDMHERGTAVYLLIDAERKAGWHLVTELDPEEPVRVVHAISRWSRGEIRGWVWARGRLFLRHPATPAEWPELDALVCEALGVAGVGRTS